MYPFLGSLVTMSKPVCDAGSDANRSVGECSEADAEATIRGMWLEHTADASKVGRKTFEMVCKVLEESFWYQDPRYADGAPSCPGRTRYSCPLYSKTLVICARRDINPDEPRNLPICDDKGDNKLLFGAFVDSILVYLVEELEMPKRLLPHVRFWGFAWGKRAGLGEHTGKRSLISCMEAKQPNPANLKPSSVRRLF